MPHWEAKKGHFFLHLQVFKITVISETVRERVTDPKLQILRSPDLEKFAVISETVRDRVKQWFNSNEQLRTENLWSLSFCFKNVSFKTV